MFKGFFIIDWEKNLSNSNINTNILSRQVLDSSIKNLQMKQILKPIFNA